jgi:oxygen-dependent protoporphyrinogen oxidase
VRASTGRFGDRRFTDLDDGALVQAVLDDLATTSAIDGEPSEVRVNRWMDAFPQYEVGHLDRVATVERELAAEEPRVVVAGAALRGLGVPACIRQGRDAATTLVERAGS